jgi:hypothetical protein
VSKSHIPATNAPERVEIPLEGMNSTQVPNPRKRGREPDELTQPERRRPQGQDYRANVLHSHLVIPKVTHPEGESGSAPVHTTRNNSTGASKQPVILNMGNQDELDDLSEEIATDYAKSRELYNRKTTNVDINFVSKIIGVIDEDPEPKSMAECRKCSDWVKWKEAIET